MPDISGRYDVLIAGGGNAALCAAIPACRAVAESVPTFEAAPHFYCGPNTRHTPDMRCALRADDI
jgi:tricarballylate dehydrogenase